ncbi:hypothetical protein DMW20_11750 [Vibrio parahaemolyticus]|nr:hypothetical protein [Vibrio parahaemolyticus]
MAGLASAFRTGFQMADSVERGQEEQRRYEAQQERLARQDERQAKADARQEQLFGLQLESLQHEKERRPTLEKQQDELFKTQQQTAKISQQQSLLNIKAKKKELQQAEIADTWNIGWNEFKDTGTISPETYEKMAASGSGTAFDISNMTDPKYMKAVDNLNNVAKMGFANSDPNQLIGDFNTVFKNDINRFHVTDGAAYNRVTGADVDKEGNFTFKITAFDQEGNPMKTVYSGDPVPYRKLVDGAFSRKAIIASVVAAPQFKAQLDYAHSKYGQKVTGKLETSNIKYAQTLYRDIMDDAEKNKRAVRRSYQDMPMADTKKMDAELAAIDQETNAKIAQLSKMFTKSEISGARIPSTGLGGGQGVDLLNQGQSTTDDEKRAQAIEALKAKGLLKE